MKIRVHGRKVANTKEKGLEPGRYSITYKREVERIQKIKWKKEREEGPLDISV